MEGAMSGTNMQVSLATEGTECSGLDSPPFHTLSNDTSGELNALMVRKIHQGERAAEELLCRKFIAPVQRALGRRGLDAADAQDVAQETLLIVIRKLRESGLRDPERLTNYIFRTARNVHSAGRRRAFYSKRCHQTDVYELLDAKDSDQSEAVRRDELKGKLREVLGLLSQERDKQVLIQRYLLELPKNEVCQNLLLTPVQFDRVLFNARKRLARLVSSTAVSL